MTIQFFGLAAVLVFFGMNAAAREDSTPCFMALNTLNSVKRPMTVKDPAGPGSPWTLTWEKDLMFRSGFGSKKSWTQPIWTAEKQQLNGDGATGVAPALQVVNAKRFFVNKALIQLKTADIPAAEALAVDAALAACETQDAGLTEDGEPQGKTVQGEKVGDLATSLRKRIREAHPAVFKQTAPAKASESTEHVQ